MDNNPAFLTFFDGDERAVPSAWPTAEEKMLLVSVGSGASANANSNLSPEEMNLIYNAATTASALMAAAPHEQDFLSLSHFGKWPGWRFVGPRGWHGYWGRHSGCAEAIHLCQLEC